MASFGRTFATKNIVILSVAKDLLFAPRGDRRPYRFTSPIASPSDSLHSGIFHPSTRSSFPQSILEFNGRLAGVGYSAVVIASTVASFAPGSSLCNSAIAAPANPYHVVSPLPLA